MAEAVETHGHIRAEDAEDWMFSDLSDAEFDAEAALIHTLGLVRGPTRCRAARGGSVEEFAASEFRFPVQHWDLYR
ncbi:hypothetical protein ABTY63_33770 [Streptomyces solisilvae]|uniref:hypothetical protein n=1 Tax=Streptomyces malaysiensis TaxID=92644 RepID=UPI00332AAC9F